MLDRINEFAYSADGDMGKIIIENKDDIEYTTVVLDDYRIDNLIFNHYGYNLDGTYGLRSEIIIYLIFMFNDFNNLLNVKGVIKLPLINQLLDNLYINENVNVNGVYDNSSVVLTEQNSNDNSIIDELKLRLKRTQIYDAKGGIIKY